MWNEEPWSECERLVTFNIIDRESEILVCTEDNKWRAIIMISIVLRKSHYMNYEEFSTLHCHEEERREGIRAGKTAVIGGGGPEHQTPAIWLPNIQLYLGEKPTLNCCRFIWPMPCRVPKQNGCLVAKIMGSHVVHSQQNPARMCYAAALNLLLPLIWWMRAVSATIHLQLDLPKFIFY